MATGEQKILAEFLNGMGAAKLKGILFNQFTTLALAEAAPSMANQGAFCQVNSVVYFRQTQGQALKALIDEVALSAQLSTLSTNLSNQIAQSKAFTAFDASSATQLPTGAGVKNGQGFYVTSSGTVAGVTFTANDVFFSKKDNPTVPADFGDIVPIAQIATAGVMGVVKIAQTLAEYNAGITDTNLAVSAPALKLVIDAVNGSINNILNSRELEIATATVTANGIVSAFTTWAGAVSDKTRIVTTGLLKNLFDYTNAAIAVLANRVTATENRIASKFTVECVDSNGVETDVDFASLQAAVDYAHGQTAPVNKRIIIKQDAKITATIKLKSSIIIDFTGHDLYANTDITLFDDALMASNNGGHIELKNINDLVVAITDTTGSTNAVMKMTGTGTNRRYRISAKNVYSAIAVFKSSTFTDGTATAFDLVVENTCDCYSTSGAIVSDYNDRYGVITAHHSTRLIDYTAIKINIDVRVGKRLRCNGFMNGTGSYPSVVFLQCPLVNIMKSYLFSGENISGNIACSSSLQTVGRSFIKAASATSAIYLRFKNTVLASLGSSFTGDLALYHAESDAGLHWLKPFALTFEGSCTFFCMWSLVNTAGQGNEVYILGSLISNNDSASVFKGGNFIYDNFMAYLFTDSAAQYR